MKNFAKYLLLFACIFRSAFYNAVDNIAIGYLHDKILEKSVPELEEFNNKLTALFRIKNHNEKIKATRDLLDFVNDTRKKLIYEIKVKKMTSGEIKAIKIALDTMKRRVNKLNRVK